MEQINSPFAAKRFSGVKRTVVLHADQTWHGKIANGEVDFFRLLEARLSQEGIPFRLTAKGGQTSRVLLAQDHIHIMVGTEPAYGPNILHAYPTYIHGFWYFDEVGIRWNSSIRLARFEPDRIDPEEAAYFFNGVTSWMMKENISWIEQNPRDENGLEQASAVVFPQNVELNSDRSHFLTNEEMIRTAAETLSDRLIYVKLHPSHPRPLRQSLIAICSDYTNVKMSSASVHDLIAASDLVVTQNSAAGFEALMQKKPVLTCGKTDYWHATLSPRTTRDLRDALCFGAQELANVDYEKYFYWFLAKRCLEPQKSEFSGRAWARIRDKAYL